MLPFDPKRTLVLVIDPQKGFCSTSGTLGRIYGAAELLPAVETCTRIAEFLKSVPNSASVVIVVSEYPAGLHTGGDLASDLSNLCIAGSEDAELADELILKEDWMLVTKRNIDAMESQELRSILYRSVPNPFRDVLIIGFTATTCVLATAISVLQEDDANDISLTIARDLVGARRSSFEAELGRASRVDGAFERMQTAGAAIVDSWKTIEWLQP
jgi:nicotinamidase-related amidase